MTRMGVPVFVAALLLLQVVCVGALSAADARLAWLDAKGYTVQATITHEDAKLQRAANNTPENRQAVVDTGKALQNAALDEAGAWLNWKKLEAQEDPLVPDDLKQRIYADVDSNLDKVTELRTEVAGVTNEFELGVMSLKMIGKYFELLADVARNVGLMWANVGSAHADRVAEFEAKLRTTAQSVNASQDVMDKLDAAASEVETARTNIANAEAAYELVRIPGTPFLKFSEGNSYLRAAQANLLSAVASLNQAYVAITTQAGV
ncbi:hypothetical protein H0O03_00675 [Candidatus Micrarchaeota archaeon]|nr:hypothetical protein [Candidatus Micrarchaeota archaeon]